MSLFGKQLLQRKRNEDEAISRSIYGVFEFSQGRSKKFSFNDSIIPGHKELARICMYYNLPLPQSLPEYEDIHSVIDFVGQTTGMMHRRIRLEGNWWKDGALPILAHSTDTGELCVLLPGRLSGYYFESENGNKTRITSANKGQFKPEAICFYKPLPQEPITGKQLLRLMLRNVPWTDYLLLILAAALVTGIGLLTPMVTRIVFGHIIPSGQKLLVISLAVLLFSTSIASYLISIVRGELMDRIRGHMEIYIMDSVMGRVLSLPASFFSENSTGGLSQSILALKSLPAVVTDSIIAPGITILFSLAYVVQIAYLSKYLAAPAFVTLVVQLLIILISVRQRVRVDQARLEAEMKLQGMSYAIFSGIRRIRLSGSENRVFVRWADAYRHRASAAFPAIFPCSFMAELVSAIALLGTLWVFGVGVHGGIKVAQFAAFLSAYGMVTGALTTFSSTGQTLATVRPILNLAEPVLQMKPEEGILRIGNQTLKGNVEMSHVSFRYDEDGPEILNDLNLKIRAGEYAAIVGRSGCGKSTLFRLLMGFESPQQGSILYDDHDIDDISPVHLRRSIGAVLQKGKLFTGDIFTNISISAPWISYEDAWEAARMAGLEDAINHFPMGMHTFITEGTGGISGGQKQQLMIARALARKPALLLLDEATSSLDNLTQKRVTDSLKELTCTRIVIAQRLSTIKECDQIYIMDNGRIVESGTYEELLSGSTLFQELAARQQL